MLISYVIICYVDAISSAHVRSYAAAITAFIITDILKAAL
jgi:hypothetical protein